MRGKFNNIPLYVCYGLIVISLFSSGCATPKQKPISISKNSEKKQTDVTKTYPKQKLFPMKRLYTGSGVVYLPDLQCRYEFCILYIVKNKKVVSTKTFVKNETVEVDFEKEGIYYIKLVRRDELLPEKLKYFDYKIIYDKAVPLLLIKPKLLNKQVLKSNSAIRICYTSFDNNPKYVSVWFSDSYKKKSEVLADKLPRRGCFNFVLPFYSTVLDFYFRAQDKCGNFSPTEKLTVVVDGDAPDVVTDIPEITNNPAVDINYTVFDRGPAGFDFLEVYVRSSYFDMKKIAHSYNSKDKINYAFAKEGIYYFTLKAYDKVGNVYVSEEKKLVYDATPPEVLVEGLERDIFYSDEKLKLKVTLKDENLIPESIQLFLSIDGGNNWQLLEFKNIDNDIYLRIPNIFTKRAMLRVEVKDKANNIGAWESNLFSIDNVIPYCEIVDKLYKFRVHDITIDYKLVKGGIKPPDRIKLFYKKEGDAQLKPYDFVYKFGDVLTLPLADGVYKVGVICINTVLEGLGKVQGLDNIKLVNLVVDTQGPKLLGVSKLKQYYRSGETVKINWHFNENNPLENEQVKVWLSYDNKHFTAIDKSFQYIDGFSYTLSALSKNLYFKIEARDSLNNVTTYKRGIKIDNTVPVYKFSVAKISNVVSIPYTIKLSDKGSGIKDAYIYSRKRGEEKWDIADTVYYVKSKRGIINVKESGYYQVKVVAFDWAGNSSDENKTASFDTEILVDINSPQITVESTKLEYFVGEIINIKTTITDNIGVKNVKVLLSINNSPFTLLTEDYRGEKYEYRFTKVGSYHFKFIVTDYAGNFVERVFKVNAKKAELNFSCPLPSIIKDKTFMFPCKLNVDPTIMEGIYIYIKKNGDKDFREFARYDTDKKYVLPEGCYEIDIVGRDIQGNTGNIGYTASKLCVIYTLPKVTFFKPIKLTYNGNDSFVDLRWQVEAVEISKANLYLEYSVDGGKTYKPLLQHSNIVESFKFSLSEVRNFEGYLYFKVGIIDFGGNVAENYIKDIYYDDIPPKIAFEGELKKWWSAGEKFTLSYCVEDFRRDGLNVKLYQKINEEEYKLVKSNMPNCDTIDLIVSGESGYNVFKVVAQDSAANLSFHTTEKLFIDGAAPSVLLKTSLSLKGKTIKLFVKGQDTQSGVNNIILYRIVDSQLVEITKVENQNEKEYEYLANEDGYYKFLARAYDRVGNMGESGVVEVRMDTAEPQIKMGVDVKETYHCGIPLNLGVEFIDNMGLSTVSVNVYPLDKSVKLVEKVIEFDNIKEYLYKGVIDNTFCKDLVIDVSAIDTSHNVKRERYTLKFENAIPTIRMKSKFKGWYKALEEEHIEFCVEDKSGELDIKLYQSVDNEGYFLIRDKLNKCDNVKVVIKDAKKFNKFRVSVKNKVGNTSSVESEELRVDNNVPTIKFGLESNIDKRGVKFMLEVDDNESGVEFFEVYKVDGNDLVKVFDSRKTNIGDFIYRVGEDGYYKFLARAYDRVGNMGESGVVETLVDTMNPIIDVRRISRDKINLCTIPIDLNIDFIDNIGIDNVKIIVEQDDDVIIDKVIKAGVKKYTYSEVLPNSADKCKNYLVKLQVKDSVGNIATNIFTIKNVKPILSYKIDFESENMKVGDIVYNVNIPDEMRPYVEKLELLGRNINEGQFVSFGYIQPKGVVTIRREGCYEFAVVGYLSNNVHGEILPKTKACFYDIPKIDIEIKKPYDVYSPMKNLKLDYKITNFSDGLFLYSFDNKEFKPYKKLTASDTISFTLSQMYEGIVYLRLDSENILGERTSRQFEIKYDGVPPRVLYEWLNLNSQYYGSDFKDKLKLQCLDSFLPHNPLSIYLRSKENEQFEKVIDTASNYVMDFNFGPYEQVQFKFLCVDLGDSQTEVITPFYVLDKSPPSVDVACQYTRKENKMVMNVEYNAIDSQSGVSEVEVVLYKNGGYYNLLYKGAQTKNKFDIDITENGVFGVEITVKDKINNFKKLLPQNCSAQIDFTSPKLEVEIPKLSKYPSNKIKEFTYIATDNVGIDKVELVEIVNGNSIILQAGQQSRGTFKIFPENREVVRNFKVVVYDKSNNSASYDFSISYKNITLSYPILNNSYIINNTFDINYNFTDDIDLVQDVLLFYGDERGKLLKYGSVLDNKKVTFEDGCYKLAVIGVSKFSDTGDVDKFSKRVCVITQRPDIIVKSSAFYGKESVKIPFEVSSMELDENSIRVFWSIDRGLSWKKINKLFKSLDEVLITPEREGQIYVKIVASNKAGLSNELILKDIFISSQPPLCMVEDNLLFNTSHVNFKYKIQKRFIPFQKVIVGVVKNGVEVKSIIKESETDLIDVELDEGIYTVSCSAYDILGNYSYVDLGKLIVDYTPPHINISDVEIRRIDKNTADIQIRYRFSDTIFEHPYKVGVYYYNFALKRWRQMKIFKDISRNENTLNFSVNLFRKFSFALAAVDMVGNRCFEDFVFQRKPSPNIVNLKKPKPKIYSPVNGEVILSGNIINIRWSCGKTKSLLAENSSMYIVDNANAILDTIFEQYPVDGVYDYFSSLGSGEYFLLLKCKSKYGLEFRYLTKFFILDNLPTMKIKPLNSQ